MRPAGGAGRESPRSPIHARAPCLRASLATLGPRQSMARPSRACAGAGRLEPPPAPRGRRRAGAARSSFFRPPPGGGRSSTRAPPPPPSRAHVRRSPGSRPGVYPALPARDLGPERPSGAARRAPAFAKAITPPGFSPLVALSPSPPTHTHLSVRRRRRLLRRAERAAHPRAGGAGKGEKKKEERGGHPAPQLADRSGRRLPRETLVRLRSSAPFPSPVPPSLSPSSH